MQQPAQHRFHRRFRARVAQGQHLPGPCAPPAVRAPVQLPAQLEDRGAGGQELVGDGEQHRGLEDHREVAPGPGGRRDREAAVPGHLVVGQRPAVDGAVPAGPHRAAGPHGDVDQVLLGLERDREAPEHRGGHMAHHRTRRGGEQDRRDDRGEVAGDGAGEVGVPREADDVAVPQLPVGDASLVGHRAGGGPAQAGGATSVRHAASLAGGPHAPLPPSTGLAEICTLGAFRRLKPTSVQISWTRGAGTGPSGVCAADIHCVTPPRPTPRIAPAIRAVAEDAP